MGYASWRSALVFSQTAAETVKKAVMLIEVEASRPFVLRRVPPDENRGGASGCSPSPSRVFAEYGARGAPQQLVDRITDPLLSIGKHGGVGLYIHIPFCVQKCLYCDFYSIPFDSSLVNDYLSCCGQELSQLGRVRSLPVSTVYFGGGTPSVLPAKMFLDLAKRIRNTINNDGSMEVTLEANPCAFTTEKLEAWKQAGINRLSLGIQSFHDAELQALGRAHNSEQAMQVISNLRGNGWSNYSVDFMFGIPGQTLETFQSSLETALRWHPPHVSVYGLTCEKNTPLWRDVQNGRIGLADTNAYNAMFEQAHHILCQSGYDHYEISNYALPGFESQHNSNYWKGRCFLGIGAAAHSALGNLRWRNVRDVATYIRIIKNGRLAVENMEETSQAEQIEEQIMLGLRTALGLDLSLLKAEGFDLAVRKACEVEKLEQSGLARRDGTHLFLTLKGMEVLDEVVAVLVP